MGKGGAQPAPGAGGVPANLIQLLAISGSLACWLVCTPLAWHPQPWENFICEFQTPWFLISLLALLHTAIQLQALRSPTQQRLAETLAAVAPPLEVFSSGPGFAAAFAITAGA